MLEEVKKIVDGRGLQVFFPSFLFFFLINSERDLNDLSSNYTFFNQLVLANPGSEVMKKLDSSKTLETIGQEWIFLTVAEAVGACNFLLHAGKPELVVNDAITGDNV